MPKALQSHVSDRRLDKTLDETQAKGWTVVDLKNEWNRVLSFESPELRPSVRSRQARELVKGGMS